MDKIIGNTTATPMVVPDWNQTDEKKADYIKNKPLILDENLTNVTDKGLENITLRKFLKGEAIELKPSNLNQGNAIADFRYDLDEKGLILTKDNVTSYSFTFHKKDTPYGYESIKNFPYALKDETLSSFTIRYGEQILNDRSKLTFIVHYGIDQIARITYVQEQDIAAINRVNEHTDTVVGEANERIDQINERIEEIATSLTATNSYSEEREHHDGIYERIVFKDGDVITDILVEATDGNIYSFANDDISIENNIFDANITSAVKIDTLPYTFKEPYWDLELGRAYDQNNTRIDVKKYTVNYLGRGVLNATELKEQVAKNTDSIGDIETALDNIIAIQNLLIGGDSV